MDITLPGKRIEAFHLRNIEPEMFIGYRNVLLHCGINDIRDKSPGRISSDPDPTDVEEHFNILVTKIKEIKENYNGLENTEIDPSEA